MRTFVMGDIHGAHKALVQCLERAEFDLQNDRLIQLGDVADGFDEVYDCVETLLTLRHLIAIQGNHDEWLCEFINSGIHPDYWRQGGAATARSYLRIIDKDDLILKTTSGYKVALSPSDIPLGHQQFFRSQHLYYIDEQDNCFVHAGFDRGLPFKGQHPFLYLWDRRLWSEALSFKAAHRGSGAMTFGMVTPFKGIFIGHTTTKAWHTDQPMSAANICNLDTGAGGGGRLTIMELPSRRYWQSDPVNQLYPYA